MEKRKLLVLTNYCGAYTGFGRNCLNLLSYIYKNYKNIEIVLVAGGMTDFNSEFQRYPWKIRGALPANQHILNELQKNEAQMRLASYGDLQIEQITKEEKPDIVLAIEDEWGICFLKNKKFFNNIPVIFWSTLDSRPLLPEAINTCSKSQHYWTWSEFAAKDLRNIHNLKHCKTQYPCINTSEFYRLENHKKIQLRKEFGIPEDSIIFGFVFRNQPRKLVNKLIEGYSIFKKQNPEIKNTLLYLHTYFAEGWNISELCKQYNIDMKEILCSYVCKESKEYFVLNYQGEDINNPKTGKEKSLVTANVNFGVTQKDLNDIYNIFDFYFHPANSGASELPIIEAALTELIVSCPNYSYGEDVIELNMGSFEIDSTYYTEINTLFLKSNPNTIHIAKLMKKFYFMPKNEKNRLGKLSREWAVNNYSVENNGKKIAEYINSIDISKNNQDWDKEQIKDPSAPIPEIKDDKEWLKTLYKTILKMDVTDEDSGLIGWLSNIKNGQSRKDIETFFRQTGHQENLKLNQSNQSFESLIDNNGKKRILVVLKESIGDIILSTAILDSIKKDYSEYDLYFGTSPQYFELLAGNPDVYKCLPWVDAMESEIWATGTGNQKGLFNSYINLGITTQRHLNYLTNDRITLPLEVIF